MTARLPLSVIIITLNEADRVGGALASVAFADQIVVVDSGSEDETCDIARGAGAEVVHHPWEGYSEQKAFAVTLTRHPWVLWIDADEALSPRLQQSIREALVPSGERGPEAAAFAMNRRIRYLGRAMRFGGVYPDRKVRLFRKDRAVFDGRRVHEELRVKGRVGRLRGDLLHDSHRGLDHHITKTHQMARLWADQHHAEGHRRVSAFDLLVHPVAKAFKSYVLRGGFLEGWRGIVLAGVSTYSVWLKYALLRERQLKDDPPGGGGCDGPGGRRSRS